MNFSAEFQLQWINFSCHWEASLNHHFAGRWWRGDTSTPHFKEEKNARDCKILGDDGIGKKDLDSNIGSISQEHTGHLSSHASVLILDNLRKLVEAIWSRQTSERTWRNIIKLYQWRFRLKIRRRFFTQSVVEHWNRLHREVVMGASLSECPQFKKYLYYTLRNMVWFLVWFWLGPEDGLWWSLWIPSGSQCSKCLALLYTRTGALCNITCSKEQSGFLLSFFHPEIAYLNGADLKSLAVFQFSLNCSHVIHNVLGTFILLKKANMSRITCIHCWGYHRIVKWFVLEGTFKVIFSHPPVMDRNIYH